MMTAIVRRDKSFINLLSSRVGYEHPLRVAYQVSFLDAFIKDIVDDKSSSDFLSSDSRPTYVRSICVPTLVLKPSTVLPILRELSKEGAGTRSLGVTVVADATIYS